MSRPLLDDVPKSMEQEVERQVREVEATLYPMEVHECIAYHVQRHFSIHEWLVYLRIKLKAP